MINSCSKGCDGRSLWHLHEGPKWSTFFPVRVRIPASRFRQLVMRSTVAESLGSYGGLTDDPWPKDPSTPKVTQTKDMTLWHCSKLFGSHFAYGPPQATIFCVRYLGPWDNQMYHTINVCYSGFWATAIWSFKMLKQRQALWTNALFTHSKTTFST